MIKLSDSTRKTFIHQTNGNEKKVDEAIHEAEVILIKCKHSSKQAINIIQEQKNELSLEQNWAKYDNLCLQEQIISCGAIKQ